jgi:hypothetical protein
VPSAEPHDSADIGTGLKFFCAAHLDSGQAARWRELASRVPWAAYQQDPTWAEVECPPDGRRRALFFWMERDDALVLTALGVRRPLPVPRRVFWEFTSGPTFLDVDALDQWLPRLEQGLGREAARIHMAPPVPLQAGGDDVETVFESHGFVRRRLLGGWATMVVDLSLPEDVLLRSFRSATQRSIRKSTRLGIVVVQQDTQAGWDALSALEAELAARTGLRVVRPDELERISRLWLRKGEHGTVLLAALGDEPLAAALIITHQGTAHIPLIPTSRRNREVPASHLLVWEAMKWAKTHGCTRFDFSGYSLVARPGDTLWGINQFKRGFGGADAIQRSVAIHELQGSPLVSASAQAIRRAQAAWRLRTRKPARIARADA